MARSLRKFSLEESAATVPRPGLHSTTRAIAVALPSRWHPPLHSWQAVGREGIRWCRGGADGRKSTLKEATATASTAALLPVQGGRAHRAFPHPGHRLGERSQQLLLNGSEVLRRPPVAPGWKSEKRRLARRAYHHGAATEQMCPCARLQVRGGTCSRHQIPGASPCSAVQLAETAQSGPRLGRRIHFGLDVRGERGPSTHHYAERAP
mmetsp:Transcript_2798/g.8317  ORF Transcript_2798/g.8317 Transcript_2798/m.8317 type:complete len:208 (-) Transcript_2798:775-1398(-)